MKKLILLPLIIILLSCTKQECNSVEVSVQNIEDINYDIELIYKGNCIDRFERTSGSDQYIFSGVPNGDYTLYIFSKNPKTFIDKVLITFESSKCETKEIEFILN